MSIMQTLDSDERIKLLNDRAKRNDRYIKDLNLGESNYLLALIQCLNDFHNGLIKSKELAVLQRELKQQLETYYAISEVHLHAVKVRNKYSVVLTEAEKNGCPICKKIVRIFDGRES